MTSDIFKELNMQAHLRIARPVSDLQFAKTMYCQGLQLSVIGAFEDHQGFDGVMLGRAGMQYHFEFTHCKTQPVRAQPTAEDLIVFYLPDNHEWITSCARMLTAGFQQVAAFNPYWDLKGRTFVDADGYRVVLQNARCAIIA
ncbi:VOC family protein [Undibacterium sp. Jales W-56]|uniref:VOC family protein n=1 Tax=Undibacterium sp. Jales W-56 TaxID=2897325 RepID=UPI0021CF6ACA|nr:VOC family protein [Undibacterium sp. Jales W-56]MCU6432493.1 VOC family protein [Undibacterium sp. Jales W-56]